ncbi:hypothetical protein PMN64_00485 [Bradyrhizobium sp. UFLA01-814]|uniref:hypothetical protein n=1 Tax=Bradyrhizobium sp. UFLA01-814 TaxID=3023480 RepID=UPI00398B279B
MKHAPNSYAAIQMTLDRFPELKTSTENDDLFMCETSPPEVTGDIVEFCAHVGDTVPPIPIFVDVVPSPTAREGWCFANVADRVAEAGGEPVHGWTIWGAPSLFYTAEFHVVWKTPAGKLVDVTPKQDGEEYILFLPDDRYPVGFDFMGRPNNIRTRVYGHDRRRDEVVCKMLGFSEARLAYETNKARRRGLTLPQSIGMRLGSRDRLERLIDKFLEDVGILESMLMPTPQGMECKDPRRSAEFRRRAADVLRQKNKLFLTVDLLVRGAKPHPGA